MTSPRQVRADSATAKNATDGPEAQGTHASEITGTLDRAFATLVRTIVREELAFLFESKLKTQVQGATSPEPP